VKHSAAHRHSTKTNRKRNDKEKESAGPKNTKCKGLGEKTPDGEKTKKEGKNHN